MTSMFKCQMTYNTAISKYNTVILKEIIMSFPSGMLSHDDLSGALTSRVETTHLSHGLPIHILTHTNTHWHQVEYQSMLTVKFELQTSQLSHAKFWYIMTSCRIMFLFQVFVPCISYVGPRL